MSDINYKIEVTTMSGKTFIFHKIDDFLYDINSIKKALSDIDFFKEMKAKPIIIRLMNLDNDSFNEIYDDELITRDLDLKVIISNHLLGVYHNIDMDYFFTANASLPSEREIEAYEHAINNTDDPDYAWLSHKDGFIFRKKVDDGTNFYITDENSPKAHINISILYRDKTWYSYSSYADSIYLSNFHERHIHLSYDYIDGDIDGKTIIIPKKILGNIGCTFNNVKLEKGTHNNPYTPTIFSYVSSSKIIYVIGIPNRDVMSKEDSYQKALSLAKTI